MSYIDELNAVAGELGKNLVQESDPRRWETAHTDFDDLTDLQRARLMERKKHALATANIFAKVKGVIEMDSLAGGKANTPGMVKTQFGMYDAETAALIERAQLECEEIDKKLKESGGYDYGFSYTSTAAN